MLGMTKINDIRNMYESQGLSLNQIVKETGHCFETVKKYAHMEDFSVTFETTRGIERVKYPVLEDFIPVINQWLEDDMKVKRKQRHTAVRIFHRLRDEHSFTGGYSSVRDYVRKKKKILYESHNACVPLAHPMLHGQVDFGESEYLDGSNQQKKGYCLTISFPYSNHAYSMFFPSQNQECLLEGMKRIFIHMGGVPKCLRFDNMSTAVIKVLKGGERELSDGFMRFVNHYGFEVEFCNPASGNEKGNVENKVGYTRRNFFVPVPTVSSFEDFNEKLLLQCEKDSEREHYKHKVTIKSLWDEEKEKLAPLPPHDFPVFRYEALKVSKTGFLTVETNKYGISPALNGETVNAKIYFDHIDFIYEGKEVGSFPRSYEKYKAYYDWRKFLPTLCLKTNATLNSSFFNQFPDKWQDYLVKMSEQEGNSGVRSAVCLLNDIVQDGHESFCDELIHLGQEQGRTDVESLRQIYHVLIKEEHHPQSLDLSENQKIPQNISYDPDISNYDKLIPPQNSDNFPSMFPDFSSNHHSNVEGDR